MATIKAHDNAFELNNGKHKLILASDNKELAEEWRDKLATLAQQSQAVRGSMVSGVYQPSELGSLEEEESEVGVRESKAKPLDPFDQASDSEGE